MIFGMIGFIMELINRHIFRAPPYCKAKPYIYMDIGFKTGVPLGRVVIQLSHPLHEEPLVDNLVRLVNGSFTVPSTGKPVTLADSPVHSVDSVQGIVTFGDVLSAWPCSGGRAAHPGGVIESPEGDIGFRSAGSVMMLPRDYDSSSFSSVFAVSTQPMQIFDGKMVGQVVEGLSLLTDICDEYGSRSGVPKNRLIVQTCGQL